MRLVARRLVAWIDGTRWCLEQEGAHRPPAGRLLCLHPALVLRFECHEFTERKCEAGARPRRRDECAEMFVPIEVFRDAVTRNYPSENFGERVRGQDTQDRTGHPGQDRGHTRTSKTRDHLHVKRCLGRDKSQPPQRTGQAEDGRIGLYRAV